MTILITGSTGLVGTRLLARLVNTGIDCRILVRNPEQTISGMNMVKGDILDPSSLITAVTGVTAIIHLAAVLRTPDTEDIWKVNLDGTRNLINAAKMYAPDARFIMASTGLVYNNNIPHPSRESDLAESSMAYPASKIAAENELRASGLNWSIQRFGFVYGDNDEHIAMIPKLAGMFKWHPANKLSLIHHRDIATAMELALTGAMDGKIVNIVDDAPTTIFELHEIAGNKMPESDEPLLNPWYGHLDGSLARGLGFKPAVRTIHQAAEEKAL